MRELTMIGSWRFAASCLFLCLAFATSCAGTGAEVQDLGCKSDADCDGGLKCFDGRVCIQTSLHTWSVVMRVSPGPASGFVEEHFDTEIGGSSPTAQNWQLTRPARVRGTVRLNAKGAELSELIPGTLIATTPGKIANTHLRYTASSLLTPQEEPSDDAAPGEGQPAEKTEKWGFELRVQPGHNYDVAFWPQSKAFPPHYEQRTIGGDVGDLAIILPTSPEVIEMSGRLLSRQAQPACDPVDGPAPATACGAGCQALSGLEIALLDDKGRQRSTTTTTDAEGRFVVKADASAGALWLRFDATGDTPARNAQLTPRDKLALSLPSGTVTAAIDTQKLRKAGTIKHDLGDIDLGPLPDHHLLVRDVLGDDGLALPGAKVIVRRELVPPNRCVADEKGGFKTVPAIANMVVQRSAISDKSGRIAVRMLSGKGDITVVPPPQESASAWVAKSVELTPTADKIRCHSRRKVKGRVEFRDKPIVGATVHVQPLPPTGTSAQSADPAMAPIFVQSNDDGQYAVFLDPGRYAMIIQPPAGSALARTVSTVIDVTAPTTADAAPLDLDLAAWPPTVLHGRLLGSDGKPLAGVLVDVLGKQLNLLEDLDAVPDDDKDVFKRATILLHTHRLGSAITGEDGYFEILVAPGNLAN